MKPRAVFAVNNVAAITPTSSLAVSGYQAETGREAVLEGTGETFADLAARRRLEQSESASDEGGQRSAQTNQ
jgi:hypothetical protein